MRRTTFLLMASLLIAGCGGTDPGGSAGAGGARSSGGEGSAVMGTTSRASSPASGLVRIGASGGSVEVEVEVADDTDEMQKGLMGRTALAEDAGMLFVYPEERELSFWMKDTLIPLSIAFMDSDGRIVDIQDMQPLDQTRHYPAEPAQYALEVNQGFFAERGVQVGDTVELPQPGFASPPSSAEVVQAFRDAELEVGESYPVEQEPGWEQRPVPRTYEEAMRFLVPSLGADAEGESSSSGPRRTSAPCATSTRIWHPLNARMSTTRAWCSCRLATSYRRARRRGTEQYCGRRFSLLLYVSRPRSLGRAAFMLRCMCWQQDLKVFLFFCTMTTVNRKRRYTFGGDEDSRLL